MIPSSISNASKLYALELSEDLFTGTVPATFGNLELLELLGISSNQLTSDPSIPELSFLTSPTNCRYLRSLGIAINPLNGIIPSTIANLSTTLHLIDASDRQINGRIPDGFSNLTNLLALSLSNNELIGPIPTAFQNFAKMQILYLRRNMIQESIPSALCHLRNLGELGLGGNRLSGTIPSCLGNLTSLRVLLLESNNLTSEIPSTLWNLKDQLVLNLSSNSIGGNLLPEIGNFQVITQFDLSKNQLSGSIPSELGDIKELIYLSLAHNKLQGLIPESFGSIVNLEFLDLSNNNLTGKNPKSLEALLYLKYLNVSDNRLEGEIPSKGPFANFTAQSFMNNIGLCGAPQLKVRLCKAGNHRESRKAVVLLKYILPTTASAILILAFVFVLIRSRRKEETVPAQARLLPISIPTYRWISYHELVQATGGFDESNLLGEGSFGSVYKGILADGMIVAIKVFNLKLEGAFKSFDVECEVIRNIRHRNLIKIISSCSNIDFKALVMEYMKNGSLDRLLHLHECCLDILQRLNIMIDIALATEHLHHGLPTPVVHCDVKPSNVLLDENMVAHLSDFGIARLLGEEYGSQGIVSTKGDVYSYGIMLMEIFTRKKPTDEMFDGAMGLKYWVRDSISTGIINQVMDPYLINADPSNIAAKEQCVLCAMRLALDCCEDSPEMRINIRDALHTLKKIKDQFLKSIQRIVVLQDQARWNIN